MSKNQGHVLGTCEDASGFLGLFHRFTAMPRLAIEQTKSIDEGLEETIDYLAQWWDKRGAKAKAIELSVMADLELHEQIKKALDDFVERPFLKRLQENMPVNISIVDWEGEVYHEFTLGGEEPGEGNEEAYK